MFSMFFGAGNVVFPLIVGQTAGDQTFFALLGLILTAVGVPFLGLIAILLFQGNYQSFFGKLGKWPGFLTTTFIMLLIGPFGGLPRCIALSFSTLKQSWSSIEFSLFSFISCLLIFFFAYKKTRMLHLLGVFLTPFLLFNLGLIVAIGLSTADYSANPTSLSASESFWHGFMEGYNTMDLLASFFFSAMIYNTLKLEIQDPTEKEHKQVLSISLKASCVGGALLACVYLGFCLVAAGHTQTLSTIDSGELLGVLTMKILGPYAGIIAAATISLACLTTAIALAAVFAEFLRKEVFRGKITYLQSLIATLCMGFAVSLLEFTAIVALLFPLLEILYPALIVFTLYNIVMRAKALNICRQCSKK